MSATLATTKTRKFVWPTRAEWKQALLWPYVVFTLLIALTLAGSFAPYERVLASGHPWLPAKKDHPPCVMCGMTRSFCAMSAGRVKEANEWNRGGPALYTFGWLWLAGSFVLFIRRQPRR
jgi:hypothetical protein